MVAVGSHGNTSQHCTDDKRPDVRCRRPCVHLQHVVWNQAPVHRGRALLLKDEKTPYQAFHAQQVVAVCWDLDLVDDGLGSAFSSEENEIKPALVMSDVNKTQSFYWSARWKVKK